MPSLTIPDSGEDATRLLSVVIPIYNEAGTLEKVIRSVLLQPEVAEVIAIDDGSTDGSRAILEKISSELPRLRVRHHDRNKGKGAAVRTGIAATTAPIRTAGSNQSAPGKTSMIEGTCVVSSASARTRMRVFKVGDSR